MARIIAPGIVRAGIDPGDDEQDERRRAHAAAPRNSRPLLAGSMPTAIAAMPTIRTTAARATPAPDDLGGLLVEPALVHDMVLELLLERRDVGPELRAARRARCSPRSPIPRSFSRAYSSAADRRPARCLGPVPSLSGSTRTAGPVSMPTFAEPEQPLLLAEREQAAAGEVEQGGRQRPARGLAVEDQRAGGGRQLGRRRGDVDRRIVEVLGIAAVPQPRPDRPARRGRGTRSARRPGRSRRRSGARRWSRAACSGRRVRVDLLESREERPVQISLARARQHVVLEDLLALAVVEERGSVAGRRRTAGPGRGPARGRGRTGSRGRRRSPAARRPTGPSARWRAPRPPPR